MDQEDLERGSAYQAEGCQDPTNASGVSGKGCTNADKRGQGRRQQRHIIVVEDATYECKDHIGNRSPTAEHDH